jgi:hypothetical protein
LRRPRPCPPRWAVGVCGRMATKISSVGESESSAREPNLLMQLVGAEYKARIRPAGERNWRKMGTLAFKTGCALDGVDDDEPFPLHAAAALRTYGHGFGRSASDLGRSTQMVGPGLPPATVGPLRELQAEFGERLVRNTRSGMGTWSMKKTSHPGGAQ